MLAWASFMLPLTRSRKVGVYGKVGGGADTGLAGD